MPLSPTNWLDIVQVKPTSLPHCGWCSSQERGSGRILTWSTAPDVPGLLGSVGWQTCRVCSRVYRAAMEGQRGQRGGKGAMEAAAIPAFDATGNLPPGIYRATLDAIQARFCRGEVRAHWGQVLREVVALAQSTGRVEAMYIFGSFVTAKVAPADLDLFVIMAADFVSERVEGRARLLFDRSRAALVWGICLYWMTAQTDRTSFLAAWQLRRDGGTRGIVEIQW